MIRFLDIKSNFACLAPRTHGMTFVEVLFAIAIAAMLSVGMYGSAIYTMRQTARNIEHTYALQIVSSAAAKVRAANFSKLTGTTTAADFEHQFFTNAPVSADPNVVNGNAFTLGYELRGFGTGIKKQNKNWSILTIPDKSADWEKNEFAGHVLAVTAGKGANQVMAITQNHKSMVKNGIKTVMVRLDQTLQDPEAGIDDPTDATGPAVSWTVEPDSTSVFVVDYGLYCDITTTWGDGTGYKTLTETVYAPTN